MTFELHGYFEQVFDPAKNKTLGTRLAVLEPGRICGVQGRRGITLSGRVELTRGHKTVTLNLKRPLPVETMIYPLCGRIKDGK